MNAAPKAETLDQLLDLVAAGYIACSTKDCFGVITKAPAAARETECLAAVAAVLWPAPGARGLPDVLAIAEVRKHLSFLAPKGGK